MPITGKGQAVSSSMFRLAKTRLALCHRACSSSSKSSRHQRQPDLLEGSCHSAVSKGGHQLCMPSLPPLARSGTMHEASQQGDIHLRKWAKVEGRNVTAQNCCSAAVLGLRDLHAGGAAEYAADTAHDAARNSQLCCLSSYNILDSIPPAHSGIGRSPAGRQSSPKRSGGPGRTECR